MLQALKVFSRLHSLLSIRIKELLTKTLEEVSQHHKSLSSRINHWVTPHLLRIRLINNSSSQSNKTNSSRCRIHSKLIPLAKIKLSYSNSSRLLNSSQALDRVNSSRQHSSNRILEFHSITIKVPPQTLRTLLLKLKILHQLKRSNPNRIHNNNSKFNLSLSQEPNPLLKLPLSLYHSMLQLLIPLASKQQLMLMLSPNCNQTLQPFLSNHPLLAPVLPSQALNSSHNQPVKASRSPLMHLSKSTLPPLSHHLWLNLMLPLLVPLLPLHSNNSHLQHYLNPQASSNSNLALASPQHPPLTSETNNSNNNNNSNPLSYK